MTRPAPRNSNAVVTELAVVPLTRPRWPDLERLFRPSGAYSNCWCTYLRQTGREFSAGCANGGAGNRALLRRLADAGHEPGLIAYRDREPIGWVSVGPRPEFGRILRSPITHLGADEAADAAVWSVVCFWMPRAERGKGLARRLLAAAVAHARERGASRLEGYPVDTAGRRIASSDAYTGTLDLFRDAGFRPVEERVRGRPVVELRFG
jgi:GNAT superfamily N-acetyltransferase